MKRPMDTKLRKTISPIPVAKLKPLQGYGDEEPKSTQKTSRGYALAAQKFPRGLRFGIFSTRKIEKRGKRVV
jgi:hypothetical protein